MDVKANRGAMDPASKGTILVLGGDGFCGWPISLHLSALGYDVAIVDNLSRRKIDIELGTESLTPIWTPEVRLAKWAEISGKTICFHRLTTGTDYTELVELLKDERPSAIVHFAEQRAAPYSMKSPQEMRYTVRNNLNGTHDLLRYCQRWLPSHPHCSPGDHGGLRIRDSWSAGSGGLPSGCRSNGQGTPRN